MSKKSASFAPASWRPKRGRPRKRRPVASIAFKVPRPLTTTTADDGKTWPELVADAIWGRQ